MTENLGKLGKDKITGFSGIITGYCQYLTGCHTYGLVPKKLKQDGGTVNCHWFDVDRIEIVGKGVAIKSVSSSKNPGGPQDVPFGKNG